MDTSALFGVSLKTDCLSDLATIFDYAHSQSSVCWVGNAVIFNKINIRMHSEGACFTFWKYQP